MNMDLFGRNEKFLWCLFLSVCVWERACVTLLVSTDLTVLQFRFMLFFSDACCMFRYCPQCKERRQASKKLDLWRLPEVLVIHLKRFSYSRSLKHKLETFVNFPIRDFDLTNYVANKSSPRRLLYELYALTNHYGGMGSGHYTAHIKVSKSSVVVYLSFVFLFQKIRTRHMWWVPHFFRPSPHVSMHSLSMHVIKYSIPNKIVFIGCKPFAVYIGA